MFDECPERYRFNYLERPDVAETPSPHLVLGNAIHKALAFLYRLPVEQRGEEAAHHALRHFWRRIGDRDLAFEDDDEQAAWGRRALEALSGYCRDHDLGAASLALEEWVHAEIGEGAAIAGVIDRLERHPTIEDALRVIDYKTGRCHYEEGSELAEDRGAQVYGVAASKAFGRTVAEVRFIYVCEGRELSWPIEAEELPEIAERLRSRIAEVRATSSYPTDPGPQCRWCRYRELCPDGGSTASLQQLRVPSEVPF